MHDQKTKKRRERLQVDVLSRYKAADMDGDDDMNLDRLLKTIKRGCKLQERDFKLLHKGNTSKSHQTQALQWL